MTISLAFLAPNLVKAVIEGRLPRGMGVERLRDAPVEWSRQHEMLGLLGNFNCRPFDLQLPARNGFFARQRHGRQNDPACREHPVSETAAKQKVPSDIIQGGAGHDVLYIV